MEEDSLFPISATRKREGGRSRDVDSVQDVGSSNRTIGMSGLVQTN